MRRWGLRSLPKRGSAMLAALGPSFHVEETRTLARQHDVSLSCAAHTLRWMTTPNEYGRPRGRLVRQVQGHAWAITSTGQDVLKLELTADREYVEWLMVQGDAFLDDPAKREQALDIFRWVPWDSLDWRLRTEVAVRIVELLTSHGWVRDTNPRRKAVTAFSAACLAINDQHVASELLHNMRSGGTYPASRSVALRNPLYHLERVASGEYAEELSKIAEDWIQIDDAMRKIEGGS